MLSPSSLLAPSFYVPRKAFVPNHRYNVMAYRQGAALTKRQMIIATSLADAEAQLICQITANKSEYIDSRQITFLSVPIGDKENGPFNVLSDGEVITALEGSFTIAYKIACSAVRERPSKQITIADSNKAVITTLDPLGLTREQV